MPPLGDIETQGLQAHLVREDAGIQGQETGLKGLIPTLCPGPTFPGEAISAERLSPSEHRGRIE